MLSVGQILSDDEIEQVQCIFEHIAKEYNLRNKREVEIAKDVFMTGLQTAFQLALNRWRK
jgi:hypothetical protein